jgi:hypothetical protein
MTHVLASSDQRTFLFEGSPPVSPAKPGGGRTADLKSRSAPLGFTQRRTTEALRERLVRETEQETPHQAPLRLVGAPKRDTLSPGEGAMHSVLTPVSS